MADLASSRLSAVAGTSDSARVEGILRARGESYTCVVDDAGDGSSCRVAVSSPDGHTEWSMTVPSFAYTVLREALGGYGQQVRACGCCVPPNARQLWALWRLLTVPFSALLHRRLTTGSLTTSVYSPWAMTSSSSLARCVCAPMSPTRVCELWPLRCAATLVGGWRERCGCRRLTAFRAAPVLVHRSGCASAVCRQKSSAWSLACHYTRVRPLLAHPCVGVWVCRGMEDDQLRDVLQVLASNPVRRPGRMALLLLPHACSRLTSAACACTLCVCLQGAAERDAMHAAIVSGFERVAVLSKQVGDLTKTLASMGPIPEAVHSVRGCVGVTHMSMVAQMPVAVGLTGHHSSYLRRTPHS